MPPLSYTIQKGEILTPFAKSSFAIGLSMHGVNGTDSGKEKYLFILGEIEIQKTVCQYLRKVIPVDKQSENFEKIKVQLHEQGYHEKDVTITSGKAMILGVFYAVPFVMVFGLLYYFLLIERTYLLEISGLSFYIIIIAIIAISVVIH